MTVPFFEGLDPLDKASIDKAFEGLQIAPIACCDWPDEFPYAPGAGFRMLHNSQYLFIRDDVEEECIAALASRDNEEVYPDSCAEFFFQPEGEDKYYNLEASCIGTLYYARRSGRLDPEHSDSARLKGGIRYPSRGREPFAERKGGFSWNLTLAVPVSCLWRSDIKSWKGLRGRFNVYKCGDNLSTPHYLSYAPVRTARPDFHRPEYFTDINFE